MAPKSSEISSKGENPKKEIKELPEPLDGGYGWVIVVAAFFIHVIVDGASFGYGVVSKHIKDYYGVSESQATLVGSLQLGFYLLSCPFGGKMVEKWGFRITCFSGAILATTGFALAQLSPNIVVMMLTYGVIAGTGFGLMYLASISAVTLYFDKKRVLATGLATSGSGLGMFAFSGICGYLIEIFDWKNALLIIAGIILQGCVIGMLLRPLDSFKKNKSKQIKYSAKDKEGEATVSLLDVSKGGVVIVNKNKVVRQGDESGFESENSSERDSEDKQNDKNHLAVPSVQLGGTPKDKTDLVIQSLHNIGSSLSNIENKTDKHMEEEDLEFKNSKKKKVPTATLR